MHIKRGLLFGISFLLIIALIVFVSAAEIAGPGNWEQPLGNDVTGDTFTIDLSVPSEQPVFNMVVEGITGVQSAEDYVTFEIWEKDTHELGGDDPIFTHELGNEIVGTYSGGVATGVWEFDPVAAFLSDGDADGIHEFYYKMSIGPEGANIGERGTTTATFNERLINIEITWPGQMIDPSLYWWGGPYSMGAGATEPLNPPTVLTVRTIDAQDLFNENDNRLSNVIYPVLDGIDINQGTLTQSQVYFQVWADTCSNREYPIRVGNDAITATVIRGDSFGTGPWYISLEDILKSPPHCGDDCYESNGVYYRYTFDALFGGHGGVCMADPPLVDIFINWSGFSFPERWLDRNAALEITDLDLSGIPLGTEESKVYIEISGLPSGEVLGNGEIGDLTSQQVVVEVWELDNPHTWGALIGEDLDSDGVDDAIKTGGEALVGTVDSTGTVTIPWTITDNDILKSENEQTYEFHFTFGLKGAKGQIIPIPQGNNLLRVTTDEPAGCDPTGSTGAWYYPFGTPVGTDLIAHQGDPIIIHTYTTNLNCLDDTNVLIEIYEFDQGSDPDPIRTSDPSTGAPLLGQINGGILNVPWGITEEDLIAGGADEGTIDDPYEFYYKIIIGQGETDFSDVLLNVYSYEVGICPSINYCGDYYESGLCNPDDCQVANRTGLDLYGYDCTLPGRDCWCYWDDAVPGDESCEWAFTSNPDPPSPFNDQCNFIDDPGTDTCDDDGKLSFTWTAEIIWDASNSFAGQAECEAYAVAAGGTVSDCVEDPAGTWRYDPSMLFESCEGGSNIILCPARVQLSFWDWRNVVIVVLAIVIIYLIIEVNNKKKRKKNITKKKK